MEFDLVIIGGGPAGYSAAIRAAQLKMKVACVEKRKTLGGTCLNVGCIPSKSLLHFSEKYEEALHHLPQIGIDTKIQLNLDKMLAQKDQIVSDLTKGIEGLFAKNKITRITASAHIIDKNTIGLSKELAEGLIVEEQITAKNILIATGSEVLKPDNIKIDEKFIVSSTGALHLSSIPKKLVVIGGGYIGLELGSVWRRLGSHVTVVEYADRILPLMDQEIAANFMKILQKQGIEFICGTKVTSAAVNDNQVVISMQKNSSAENLEMVSDVVLVSIGRKPNTQNLALEKVNIKIDERGYIEVDKNFQTAIANIYAVGDVIKGPMLAHKAEEEGITAVEIIAGMKPPHVDHMHIPSVIYTSPEVASIGATEEMLKSSGRDYKIGKFPFMANSRARAIKSTDGMVKILVDSKTDEVLGAHIIGSDAGNLIAEVSAFMQFRASAEDIARTCHAHPSLSEAIKEAALASDKRAINF